MITHSVKDVVRELGTFPKKMIGVCHFRVSREDQSNKVTFDQKPV